MMPAATDMLIERWLNHAVARARADTPRTAELLRQLAGRRLEVQILGTPWSPVIESTGETLKLHPARNEASPAGVSARADALIAGAPLSLLALAADEGQAAIQRGDVRIEGDAEIAQQFRALALLLRPDLEAGLARALGRSGAHIAMRGLRGALDWTRAAAWTSIQNVSEYLAHESGDLVSRAEAEHFLRGVEQLREQLDRLDARVQHAAERARNLAGGPEPA
jgi:ubiquinone biosynthesis protein UbiJ